MIGFYLWEKSYKQEQCNGFKEFKRYVLTKDEDAKEKLTISFLPYIEHFARQFNYIRDESYDVSEDDLQEGALIVAEEISKFDFDVEPNYTSYMLLERKIATATMKRFIDAREAEFHEGYEIISLNDPSLYNVAIK